MLTTGEPDLAQRNTKSKAKALPPGCTHHHKVGIGGWCADCSAIMEAKIDLAKKKADVNRWRAQDRAAERMMRFGGPKSSPAMSRASFVQKVRNAGPRGL